MPKKLPEAIAEAAAILAQGPSPELVKHRQDVQVLMAGGPSSIRLYHVVVINERTGQKFYMTETPVTHQEGCTLLLKLSGYSWRRNQLEEVIY